MSKKSGKSVLGRALIKDRFKGTKRNEDSRLHTTELDDGVEWNKLNLNSVTGENAIDEFLTLAELADKQFTAERLNVTIASNDAGLPSEEEERKQKEVHKRLQHYIRIPRRPHWDETTTSEELDLRERDAFLDWRRSLAILSETEGVVLMPYERNIEVWRQLWRVIERSDAIVQIIDARNPLLFRCQDLESYVREVNPDKQNMLLLNKAEFLTLDQRKMWAKYFDEQGVKAVFWSAFVELSKIKGETNDAVIVEEEATDMATDVDNGKNSTRILTADEIIDLFRNFPLKTQCESGVLTFGLVGYPNVGKSSTLNALLNRRILSPENQEKKKHQQASVSATPGKTKHFQTFYIDQSLLLCDCPGLVMPSFVSTKAEMIINGILPIDQMTDCIPPTSLVCKYIPRPVLECTYGIMLPISTEEAYPNRNPTAYELLAAYARIRGFMTHKGIPDVQRASRLILKDYVNGKICYCHSPPGISEEEFKSKPTPPQKKIEARHMQGIDLETYQPSTVETEDLCLSEQMPSSGIRGVIGQKFNSSRNTTKHHGNAKKKQKLRRAFGHLDA